MPTEVSSGVLGSTPVSLHNNKGIEDVMISLSLLRHRRSEENLIFSQLRLCKY